MQQFREILCVVDSQASPDPVVERAVALAQSSQARLTLVAVLDPVPAGLPEVAAAMRDACSQRLQALAQAHRARVDIATRVLHGTRFLEVIREAQRIGAGLVMKTADNPAWLQRLFGSDDMHLLRKCPCPVWLVKPGAPDKIRRIVAAVDVDDGYPAPERATRHALNLAVLAAALERALPDLAELHVVAAWAALGESAMHGAFLNASDDNIQAYIEQVRLQHETSLAALMQEMAAVAGPATMDYVKPQTHLIKGQARHEIPALAHQLGADLVVMGTVARTGIPGLLMGNTAENILAQINCSVLAIKPPGFVSPVG